MVLLGGSKLIVLQTDWLLCWEETGLLISVALPNVQWNNSKWKVQDREERRSDVSLWAGLPQE